MSKTKKKTKRKNSSKKRKSSSSFFFSFTKQIHKRKHFAAIMIIVLIAWTLLISNMFTKSDDYRPDRIESYFSRHDMPLSGHGQIFVDVADHYDLDWRLLPAIAVRESSGGKHMQLNNPFGWGSAKIPFVTLDDAIWEVGRNISGNNTNTARYYSTTSTYKKLYYYNGTVAPTYPDEVIWIMEQF